jgi:F0F1-type ATP synthase assembly protein I
LSEESPDKYWWVKQASVFTTIPMLLVAGPLIGYVIGNFLDKKLGTQPYLMAVFVILGFVVSGQQIYQMIKKFSPKD